MTKKFKGAQVLITGGLGFIGSNLARRLVDLDADVTVVDSLIPRLRRQPLQRRSHPRPHPGKRLLRSRHPQPASSRPGQGLPLQPCPTDQPSRFHGQPTSDLEINCQAQLSILETCRAVNPKIKIVFASTRQIYGRPLQLPVPETHPLNPVDVNGINKMAGEQYHLLYNNVYGIPATALRLTNTIGPRMRIKDARQTFVGLWVRQLLEGKPISVWGGKQLSDFTDVEEAVDAFLLAAASPATNGQVYNLGGSEVIDLAGVAKLMVAINGSGEYEER
jgi:UDP-glucose 4-epimerase